jgi:hypothetical protein
MTSIGEIAGYCIEALLLLGMAVGVWLFCGRVGWYMMIDTYKEYHWGVDLDKYPSFTRSETFMLGPGMMLVAVVDYLDVWLGKISKEMEKLQEERATRWDK